jgi:hypothetical protein
MSEELRSALRQMKEAVEGDDCPVYLHDPETGKAFGVLLPLRLDPTESMANHSHREGDEDDWDEESP